MHQVAQQLERVRRRGRALLMTQRLAQALAVVLPVFVLLGLIDFGLRLPGWLRALTALVLLGFGLSWLIGRLVRAWRFGPSLSALALRVEAMVPGLSGLLTSSLEFGLSPEKYAHPASTAAMAQATVARAEKELAGVEVGRLIDLQPTRRRAAWLLGSAVLFSGVVAALPTHSAIAASRWLMPWGETAWPKRTQIRAADLPAAAAIDSPVEFTAHVGRGFRPGMRVWLNTQWLAADGQPVGELPERFLMTEQATRGAFGTTPSAAALDSGTPFKLQWRAPVDVARRVSSGSDAAAKLRVWFEAGDDRTPPQVITLVARPALGSLVAEIQPPGYAAGLAAPQTVALHEQSQRIASAAMLAGARVRLTLGLNKPLPPDALEPAVLTPGLASLSDLTFEHFDPQTVVMGFTLLSTTQTRVALTDAHGLSAAAERVIRFEAIEDRRPSVTILEPSADTSVLASALLPVAARAGDDVGVATLSIEAEHPNRLAAEESIDEAQPTARLVLADRVARSAQLTADASLDLASLPLRVGDAVTLGATTQDVFDLAGVTHKPVAATPRRLRIIDANTLIDQVRGDLAGVRQQAQRLERQQEQLRKRLADDRPARLNAEQSRITRALETQQLQLERITDRLQLNRLNDAGLDELIRQADSLAELARASSEAAQESLQDAAASQASEASDAATRQAKQAAEQQQAQARERLDDLAKLLDQGRDALGLRLELGRLQAEQQALAQDTRELLPRTAGRSAEDLPEDLQQALRELAQRQEALGEQAEDAIERLQSSSESLAQQGESDQDRAAAQALAEAAAVAQRQGLSEQMQQSQQGLEDNQLSQAGAAQMQSLDTLDQMMKQLGEQDELRQELLRRRLLALADQLRRLIEGQTLSNAAVEELPADASAQALAAQVPDQSNLWVRTIAVQTEVEADPETAGIAPVVEQAVGAQALALAGLRSGAKEEAQAGQGVALERLEEALAQVETKQAEAAQDQTADQRAELRQKYLELAARQNELRAQTEALLAQTPLTRKTRAALRGLSRTQDEILTAAAELSEQVGDTVVFRRTHELIDQTSAAASAPLSRGRDDGQVLRRQAKVALLLESMAAALDDSGRPPEFADSSSGGGGGGGGGGGAGQEPPLVPSAAELKLLRAVQQSVYDETRSLGDAVQGEPTTTQAGLLSELAQEQAELSNLGERLIQEVQRQRR